MSDSKVKKDRSPNFPFINLQMALERARQFWNKEKRSAAPFAVAAGHWGYSVTSSGALQTAGALKSYGLLLDDGVGGSRKLKLSELALRILLDERPEDNERKRYMREAALNPAVAAEVYKKWSDGLPSDANLRHYLVLERSFNEATAVKVVRILKENELLTQGSESPVQLQEEDVTQEEALEAVMDIPQVPSTVKQLTSQPKAALPIVVSAFVERIGAPDAEIMLQFSGNPTWETYDFLEKYVALRKSVLTKKDKIQNNT